MKRSQKYLILGDPKACARPRFTEHHVYDSQRHLKLTVGLQLQQQHNNQPLFSNGPLRLDAIFYFESPKRAKRTGYHSYKPDLDNVLKLILDCSQGIIFENDCTVSEILCKKIYGSPSRTEFTITEI